MKISVVKNFIKNRKGAALPLIAVLGTALIGIIGTATDVGRAQITQSRLSAALDAAALAGAKHMDDKALAKKEVRRYTEANFQNYLDGELYDFEVNINNSRTRMDVKSKVRIPATFMRVFQKKELEVYAETVVAIGEGIEGEIVLVLDNTGSMIGELEDLKTAANDLVNDLFAAKSNNNELYIGVVPFAQSVNINTQNAAWTEGDTYFWGPFSWDGCVEARTESGHDTTDEPPSVAPFTKYYVACGISSYNYWYGNNTPSYNNCKIGGADFKINGFHRFGRGPNLRCGKPITTMQSSPGVITDAINKMVAGGNTHINLGLVWAWRMLSPKWRGLWGGEMNARSLPADYGAETNKIVILMTDGGNDVSTKYYSAYGLLTQGKLGTTDEKKAEEELDKRLLEICNAMKKNDITIYTVALGSGLSSDDKKTLRKCATMPEYAITLQDSKKLNENFKAITQMIGTEGKGIRLVK